MTKYLSKISKGGNTIHIKDAEARECLIESSHEYVDLGLPSGTLWATMNVGASSETDFGNYYMYGKGATQYTSGDSAYTGTEVPLAASADTATQVWGEHWHMPTQAQFQELINNTNYSWQTNFNGSRIKGGKFITKTDNTKYVFFPAAGYYYGSTHTSTNNGSYWSSTLKGSNQAYHLWLGSSTHTVSYEAINEGHSIRPVCDSAPLGKLSDKADKADVFTDAEGEALQKTITDTIFGFVDLGLPSGLLWASCNMGASKPEEAGMYYFRGALAGHYASEGFNFNQDNYEAQGGWGHTGSATPNLDAAYQIIGSLCHIPTSANWEELLTYTTQTKATINGIVGCLFTSTVAGHTNRAIFLPLAGYGDGTSISEAGERGLYHQDLCVDEEEECDFFDVWLYGSGVKASYNEGYDAYRGAPIRCVATKSVIQKLDDKVDKVPSAANDCLAAFDGTGNIKNTGKKLSSYYTKSEVYTKTQVDSLIDQEKLKLIGEVQGQAPGTTFGKTSLVTCDGAVYISNASVTGLPTNVVTCGTASSAVVTCDNKTVTCGNNTESKWVKVV